MNLLGNALDVLYTTGVKDWKIKSQFAEYLVALKLAEEGLDVKVGKEKQMKGKHDIEVADKVKIEVKSGEYNVENDVPYVVATFGEGKQIEEKGFDNCVFVTFKEHRAKEMFVFTHEELIEVLKKPRPELSRFGKKHQCHFCYYPKYPKTFGHLLNIEKDLCKHPEEYKNRWDKISSKIK